MALDDKINKDESKKKTSALKKTIYAATLGLSLIITGCPVYGGYSGRYYPSYSHLERPHYTPFFRFTVPNNHFKR